MVFVVYIFLIADLAEIDIALVADNPGANNIFSADVALDSVVNKFLVLFWVNERAATLSSITTCTKFTIFGLIWRILRSLEELGLILSRGLLWLGCCDIRCAWLLNRVWFLWL